MWVLDSVELGSENPLGFHIFAGFLDFRVRIFGFRLSGLSFHLQVFMFRFLSLGFWVQVFRFWFSGSGSQVRVFGFRFSGSGLCFVYQVLCKKCLKLAIFHTLTRFLG